MLNIKINIIDLKIVLFFSNQNVENLLDLFIL